MDFGNVTVTPTCNCFQQLVGKQTVTDSFNI